METLAQLEKQSIGVGKELQIEKNDDSNVGETSFDIKKLVSILGGSVLGTFVAVITIYNFSIRRKTEITEVKMDLLCQELSDVGHKWCVCQKVLKDGEEIEQKDRQYPFVLNLEIKFSVPHTIAKPKKIHFKCLEVIINDYKLIYTLPEKQVLKCAFETIGECCAFYLEYPSIKDKEIRNAVNIENAFIYPENIYIYVEWYSKIFTNKEKIVFRTETPSGIKGFRGSLISSRIYKGSSYNGTE